MIAAVEVSAAQVAVAAVGLVAVLVAVWRWPALVIGMCAALGAWTVAPWLSWLAFAVVAAGVVGWWLVAPGQRVCWPGVAWLARRPPLAVLVVSAAVAGAGPDVVAPWAFVVLLAAAAWLAVSWPAPTTSPALGAVDGAAAGPHRLAAGMPASTPAVGEVLVRRSGPCPHCGGRLVAELRVPEDPAAVEGVVARAGCQVCGVRLVGVVDPARPKGGLVWLALPDVDGRAERC